MKKNKSILRKIGLLALLPLFLGGCNDLFEQNERVYTGEKLLEFNPPTVTVGERVNENDDPPVRIAPSVNLISPEGTAQSNLSISYVVDDSSTAVAGEHYSLISGSPLTISQDEVTTSLQIDITADDLEDNEVRVLYVTLQGSGEVSTSENFKTLTVNIIGESESN